MLFVLAVEIRACRIREDKDLKGIQIKLSGKSCSLKICQLADDTTLFLKSKQDVSIAMNIIEIFGNYSGLKLNKNKTDGIWLGRLKHCKEKIEGINWTTKPVKSLGIYFGYNKDECKKINLEKLLEKINKLICSWSKRRLSIMGKIVKIKSLLLPNITYLASYMIIPKDYLQKTKTKLYNFIWDGKRDRVKRDILI